MRKYKLLGATAVALLITGTSLMGGEDGNATYFGTESYAADTSVAFGTRAGEESTEGNGAYNTMIGYQSGMLNKGGEENTYVGHESGYSAQQQGSSNVAIGAHSGWLGAGSNNVMIGKNSGLEANADASIYIGDGAGKDNHRDNTLIIDNNGYEDAEGNPSIPLIYGEFDNRMLRVNGTMEVNGTIAGSFTGSDTVNNHNLLGLSSDNAGDGASDVGFSMENIESTFKWSFRTYAPSEGFAATKIGTGGTEFEVGNAGTDLSTTVVKMGGVIVFKDGHLVDTNGVELINATQVASLVQEQSKMLAETTIELKAKDQKIALLEEKQKEQSLKIAQLETMRQKVAMMESILINLALDTSKTTKDKVTLNSK